MKTANRPKLAKIYGVDYSTVFGWTKETTFPKPLAEGSTVWALPDVENWLAIHRPNRKPRPTPRQVRQAKTEAVLAQNKPAKSGNTPSRLDLINYILRNDVDKQKLVLDLLLD